MGSKQSAFDRRTRLIPLSGSQTVHVSARDISVTLDTFEWSLETRIKLVHVSVVKLLIVAFTTLTA
ncbi:hypothetical protein DPMN_172743, partial [Dreissena polymorpha]